MNFSPTYISALVIIIISILKIFKIDILEEELTPVITGITTGITGLIILIRRYKVGDLSPLGQKKK
jgi:hypothetical protein